MIIPGPIQKGIITSIIAPHGITDLIHAAQNNNTKNLLTLKSACILTSIGASQQHLINFGFNLFFILGTIGHFSHDVSFLSHSNIIHKKYIVTIITLLSFMVNSNFFFAYMILIHVPNHYRINWEFIKKNKQFNLSLIAMFTISSIVFGHYRNIYTPLLSSIYKGVIMSHIIYQERYIHNHQWNK